MLNVSLASDSVGHLAAGGIVLTRSDESEMRAEELFVSVEEIRARYRFFNTSDRDIATLVAFPMPDVAAPSDWENVAIPVDHPVNFLDFRTWVDGAAVAMAIEQRVLALGIDRTEMLRALGIPLAPQRSQAVEAIRRLPAERRRELVVEHRYKPSVGASVGTLLGTDMARPDTLDRYRRRYCIDGEFLAAAQRRQKALADAGASALAEQRIEYVLTTGAHRLGSINDFRLVVDKGAPDHLVSFCGDGQTAISATAIEIRRTEYWPERNLEVLILAPLR